jgi:hypothetical protein
MLCIGPNISKILRGEGWKEVGALRIASFGIASFGIASFGIASFGIAYFEIDYFEIASLVPKETIASFAGDLLPLNMDVFFLIIK